MSSYNAEFNSDGVLLRYIIIALLEELRNKIYYYNHVDGINVKNHVPFYYSVTGQERFLLDTFLFDAQDQGKAIGDYEKVPRGVLQLESSAIDSSSLINKYVRGTFLKEYDGVLKTFSLNTQLIPIKLNFQVDVIVSNNLELFKIYEALVSTLYKNANFYVDMGGFKVQSGINLPEDLSMEKQFDFSFTDKKEFKVSFSLEVTSFMFIFEDGIRLADIPFIVKGTNRDGIGVYNKGEIYFGNVMEEIESNIFGIGLAPVEGQVSNTGYNANIDNPSYVKANFYSETIIKNSI